MWRKQLFYHTIMKQIKCFIFPLSSDARLIAKSTSISEVSLACKHLGACMFGPINIYSCVTLNVAISHCFILQSIQLKNNSMNVKCYIEFNDSIE